MSTRCNILVGNRQFYHHHDGYPEGVGQDLAYAIAHFNVGTPKNPWHDHMRKQDGSLHAFAEYLSRGIPGRLGSGLSGRDDKYEAEGNGLHGDIEFLYLIDEDRNGKLRLHCVDIYRDLGGMRKLDEIWDLTPAQLFTLFAKPKFRMQLPGTEVPDDEQIYYHEGNITREQAHYLGLEKDLPYGESNYMVGISRVRNRRPLSPFFGRRSR